MPGAASQLTDALKAHGGLPVVECGTTPAAAAACPLAGPLLLRLSPGALRRLEDVANGRGLEAGEEASLALDVGAVRACGLPLRTAPYSLASGFAEPARYTSTS